MLAGFFLRLKLPFFCQMANVSSLSTLLESVNSSANRSGIALVPVRVALFSKERGNMWILVLTVDILASAMPSILWMLILTFCRTQSSAFDNQHFFQPCQKWGFHVVGSCSIHHPAKWECTFQWTFSKVRNVHYSFPIEWLGARQT